MRSERAAKSAAISQITEPEVKAPKEEKTKAKARIQTPEKFSLVNKIKRYLDFIVTIIVFKMIQSVNDKISEFFNHVLIS